MRGNVLQLFGLCHHSNVFYGSPFTLVINHEPFKYFMESNRFMGMLAMWAFILQEYDFDIIHKACRVN